MRGLQTSVCDERVSVLREREGEEGGPGLLIRDGRV